MSPEITAGLLLGLVSAATGLMLYRVIQMIVARNNFNKSYAKAPHAVPAKNICTDRHDWTKLYLAFPRQNILGEHLVCKKCGSISGTDMMMNGPGLEAVHEAIKIKAEKERYARMLDVKIKFDLSAFIDTWIHHNRDSLSELVGTSDSEALGEKLMEFYDATSIARSKIVDNAAVELKEQLAQERGQREGEA